MKVKDFIDWLNESFDPDDEICPTVWHENDIRSCLFLDYPVSKEQIGEVLDALANDHDASIGINWDVIQDKLKEYGVPA